MVTLGMIRHGKTFWNIEKKIQGRTDIPLSDLGQEQVKFWAEVLKNEIFDFIISSPMVRARQTARIIGNILNLDIVVEKGLVEQDFGSWEGKTLKQVYNIWPETEKQLLVQGLDFCPEKGESKRSVRKRALIGLKKYANQPNGKRILVISHNGLMKSIIYHIIKRELMPLDKKILKDDHLHLLSWDKDLAVDKINAVKLTRKR